MMLENGYIMHDSMYQPDGQLKIAYRKRAARGEYITLDEYQRINNYGKYAPPIIQDGIIKGVIDDECVDELITNTNDTSGTIKYIIIAIIIGIILKVIK